MSSAWSTWASTKWPMRALAITGMVTAAMISLIRVTSLIRATPPSRRMSAGTRSSAITAAAPASSAILAWSALTTSMITPPFNISARPTFTRNDSWEFIGFPSVLVPSHYRRGQDRARSRLDFANGFGQQSDARFDVPPLDARDGESNVRPILPRRIEVLPRRDPDSPGCGRLGHAAAGDPIGQMEPEQRIGAVAAPPRDLGQVP